MGKVAMRFRKMMFSSMGIFLLDIIIGVLFFVYEDFSADIYSVIVGAGLLVHGLFYLIRYIYDGLGKKIFALDVIFGGVAIIWGLFMMFAPAELLSSYLMLYGIGLCVIGLEMLSYGIVFMKKHEETYPLLTLTALLVIIMGILAILNPFKQFVLTLRIISYFSLVTGAFGCSYSNLFKKRTKAILGMYK